MAGRYSKRIKQEEPDATSTEFDCFVYHFKCQTCERSVQLNSTCIEIVRYDGKDITILADCAVKYSADAMTDLLLQFKPIGQLMTTMMLRLTLREQKY